MRRANRLLLSASLASLGLTALLLAPRWVSPGDEAEGSGVAARAPRAVSPSPPRPASLHATPGTRWTALPAAERPEASERGRLARPPHASGEDAAETNRLSSRAARPGELFVEPPGIVSRQVTSGVRGLDTGAPRTLVLWRLENGGAAPLARTTSDPEGGFVFPQVPIPERGLELVVAPLGISPGRPGSASPFRLSRPEPGPVRVAYHAESREGGELWIWPPRAVGDVVVAEADGVVVAVVPTGRFSASAPLVLALPPRRERGRLYVWQETPDGSLTPATPIELPGPLRESLEPTQGVFAEPRSDFARLGFEGEAP